MPSGKITRGLLFILFIGAVVLAYVFDLGKYLNFEQLQLNKSTLKFHVEANYPLAVIAFILFYIISVALAFPGSWVITIAGGFLFGTVPGAAYSTFGASTGAIILFLIARHILGAFIQERYSKRLNRFNVQVQKNGFRYMLSLRLIPLVPFFLINIFAGCTTLELFTFWWTTALGIIPGALVYAYAGSTLEFVSQPSDIASPQVISAFVLLGMLPFLPILLRKIGMLCNGINRKPQNH